VAVDTRARIQAALADIDALRFQGLLTLERARMLTGPIETIELPRELHEATKLTVYVGRQERIGSAPAYEAIVKLMHRRGVAGATVLLGVDGTVHGVRRRAKFFGRNADVPLMVIAVGEGDRIGAILPELGAMLTRPLMTLERIRVCKRDGNSSQRRATSRIPTPRDCASGRSSWSTPASSPVIAATPCITSSFAPCAGQAPRGQPACAASGAITATTIRTATVSGSYAAACPS
jgi:PII-like signaling protein